MRLDDRERHSLAVAVMRELTFMTESVSKAGAVTEDQLQHIRALRSLVERLTD